MFTRLDLRGARTILTGASSGIGRALGLRLAGAGARLVLASRNEERLNALAAEVRQQGAEAQVVATNVADRAQRAHLVQTAVARLGGLDLLINNAGVGATGWFADGSEETLRGIFEVNFFGATELTRLALPHLRGGKSPQIVNIASVAGRRGLPGMPDYCASKFALAGWSEALRAELVRQGIHVLLVCPGSIGTEFTSNLMSNQLRFAWQRRDWMTADRCAALIVAAIRRRRNELVITAEGKALVWLNRFIPRLADAIVARFAQPDDVKLNLQGPHGSRPA